MILRQIVYYSILVGVVAGLVLTAVQRLQVVPIILAAEAFESTSPPVLSVGDERHDQEDGHGHEHWAPEDGLERTLYTGISNVLTALGFALLLLSVMLIAQHRLHRRPTRFAWRRALGWSLAGYAIFWMVPALGLPPEIPLQNAAELQSRQIWWVMCVVCTAVGIGGLAFAPQPWRWFIPLTIAVPFLLGAPHTDGPMFIGQTLEATRTLEALAADFVYATAIANAAFWLVLGAMTTWVGVRINQGTITADMDSSSSVAS